MIEHWRKSNMASRAELVQICKELEIENDGMSMSDMDKAIKSIADQRFKSKKIHHSADILSKTLRKFLTNEYQYVILNVLGENLDHNLIVNKKV
jgi:hypothetical protein